MKRRKMIRLEDRAAKVTLAWHRLVRYAHRFVGEGALPCDSTAESLATAAVSYTKAIERAREER